MVSTDSHPELDLIGLNGLTNKIKTIKYSGMPMKLAKLQTLETCRNHRKIWHFYEMR